TWAALSSPFGGTYPTQRGYTDHEHLDSVELIHMNGRVQDPKIGVFVSADPLVQAPFNPQSLNRYSYAWNNPAMLFDPSGYCFSRFLGICLGGSPNNGGTSGGSDLPPLPVPGVYNAPNLDPYGPGVPSGPPSSGGYSAGASPAPAVVV